MSKDAIEVQAEVVVRAEIVVDEPRQRGERLRVIEKNVVDYVLQKINGMDICVPVLKDDGTIGHPMDRMHISMLPGSRKVLPR